MKALVVLAVGLSGAGILPALAVGRRSPVVVFLAPLTGAGLVAVAAVIEFGVGGTLPADYLGVAIAVNLAVVAWWLTAGRPLRASVGPSGWWADLPPLIRHQFRRWHDVQGMPDVDVEVAVVLVEAAERPRSTREATTLTLTHLGETARASAQA